MTADTTDTAAGEAITAHYRAQSPAIGADLPGGSHHDLNHQVKFVGLPPAKR